MRISDWSSDVCSSDLLTEQAVRTRGFGDGGPTFVGGAGDATIAFLRDFDLGFRIRRLRLVARRLSEIEEAHEETLITPFPEALSESLSAYLDRTRHSFPSICIASGRARVCQNV